MRKIRLNTNGFELLANKAATVTAAERNVNYVYWSPLFMSAKHSEIILSQKKTEEITFGSQFFPVLYLNE